MELILRQPVNASAAKALNTDALGSSLHTSSPHVPNNYFSHEGALSTLVTGRVRNQTHKESTIITELPKPGLN